MWSPQAYSLNTQEVYTGEDYHKFEASLSDIPGQDPSVAALQARETIKTSSEEKEVAARDQ